MFIQILIILLILLIIGSIIYFLYYTYQKDQICADNYILINKKCYEKCPDNLIRDRNKSCICEDDLTLSPDGKCVVSCDIKPVTCSFYFSGGNNLECSNAINELSLSYYNNFVNGEKSYENWNKCLEQAREVMKDDSRCENITSTQWDTAIYNNTVKCIPPDIDFVPGCSQLEGQVCSNSANCKGWEAESGDVACCDGICRVKLGDSCPTFLELGDDCNHDYECKNNGPGINDVSCKYNICVLNSLLD